MGVGQAMAYRLVFSKRERDAVSLIEPEEFRLAKLEELRKLGAEPYGERFPDTRAIAEILQEFEQENGRVVRAAGRITNWRDMGKASFVDIKDRSGNIQLFFQLNRLGEEKFHLHRQLEPGDIVGVEGELGKTRTGEITVFVSEFRVLAKALLGPPEKWHGLRDPEKRYRLRYVDLFSSDEVMQCFLRRAEIINAIRDFLRHRGFIEVETPMMQPIPGGGAALPFITHHNALDMDLYLRVAPELYLKRLLVGGMERVFEINRNFRNEGISTRHNPEFTMLEVYQAYADYNDMMELAETLIVHLARDVCGSLCLPWGESQIDFTPPWPRRKFWDLLAQHCQISRGDVPAMRRKAAELRVEGAESEAPDWLAMQIFDKCVEDELLGPVFVVDYPKALCPLAKCSAADPEIAERFEPYIGGMECGNAYTELNDPLEQERRFRQQVGDKDLRERVDEDFLRALAHGMPPAGGLGIGIDRLTMLLTNNTSIREVILFPVLRPQAREED